MEQSLLPGLRTVQFRSRRMVHSDSFGLSVLQHFRSAGFVAKFSSDLSKLLWAFYYPAGLPGVSTLSISISAMTFDSQGNLVLAGKAPFAIRVTPGAVQSGFPDQLTTHLTPAL